MNELSYSLKIPALNVFIVVVSADTSQAEKPTAAKERGAAGGSIRAVGTSFRGNSVSGESLLMLG